MGSGEFTALDRSGSFREGSESRMFSSATNMSRGMVTSVGDVPPLSQCLILDLITMGDQKYTRSGELRRVLGIPSGTSTEENSFGAAHSKPPPPVATEELRRFKASVIDASMKARGRAKRLDESLHKLNKYCEALNSKKQQRTELLANERPGGSSLLKIGSLSQRNSPDVLPQRLEDRTKNVVLNKRVRSSVAETRAEGRSNIPTRLPAGGEGWDKKMKRKRSVGTVFTRPMDSDGELKRVVHHKLNSEPGQPSSDAQGLRSGSGNIANGSIKSDSSSLPAGSTVRAFPKNDLEKVSLSRDLIAGSSKERIKGNNKLTIREDNHIVSPGPLTKGKASRAPRTGPIMSANSSPNIARPSGAENWEQPPSINKVNSVAGANNRKRPLSAGSSSPPMAQWVGQRPQKISRSRRANLVSPVSNLDEGQISSEGCTPSDLGARMSSVGSNGLLIPRGVTNGTQLIKVKQEIVSSPVRLSESEESGVGENRDSRLKEKGTGSSEVDERATTAVQSVGSSLLLTKKSKTLNKEEIGDGVRRQGRSGRGSSYSRACVSPTREKLENSSCSKLLKSTRPGSDKNCSKSGRPPLKKLSDRKVFTRLGHTSMVGSPDFSGESDDDREELLAAANFACNSSYLACSGSFWKKMELGFASLSIEDISFLKQQVKSADEYCESLSQVDLVHGEDFTSPTHAAGGKERRLLEKIHPKESSRALELSDEVQDNGDFCRTLDSEGRNEETPLYQRVLSALIVEDETEELEESSGGRNIPFHYSRDNYHGATSLRVDPDSRKRDKIEFEYDSFLAHQDHTQFPVDRLSCNGSTTLNRGIGIQNQLYNDNFSNGGSGLLHSENGFSENGRNGPQAPYSNASGISSFDWQYEQICVRDRLMLELQSIGLYLEAVPDLADGEDETVNQEIIELQKGLSHQIGNKKEHLNKILKAIEEARETEERGLEQIAMNRLVELAYKKKLATRGSNASKSGVTKVSKQVALAFMKRTLARCRKFEETGKSCFAEPFLRDAIFAAPPRGNDVESTRSCGFSRTIQPETANSHPLPPVSGSFPGSGEPRDFHGVKIERFDALGTNTHPTDQDFVKTGPIFNRGRKKEVLLDDVGGTSSLRAATALGNPLLGGAKGKRSERERDKDASSRNAKSGRTSMGNFKGERKMKSKPKQKTAQLSTSGNGFIDKFTETSYSLAHVSKDVNSDSSKKREVGLISRDNVHQNSSEEIKEPFDLIEELGGDNDLSNLFNSFNEDDLQDQDLVGLQIPMDDLWELNMF
ncbi:Spectrin beta chain, brain [Melia azedarach]|uniref:Spectrin beta chain, brain n=1 Tax=Melia azedarach TaxID=155640 RepID=A0ACC1YAI3_MELAZ|nr:Spectrin beta chain, brain [Melia azedarach]